MKSANQKIKLLKLVEILNRDTDDNRALTTEEIIARLEELGISCDRRTLYKDIKLLIECGYDIMTMRIGHSMGYFVSDRTFTTPEIRFLIDAVQGASFITQKKTEDLTEKLAALSGGPTRRFLKETGAIYNTRKHSNETILYMIQDLSDAIGQKKKVTFRYFDLNENKEKVFRHDGKKYVAEPLALICNNNNYYLLSWTKDHGLTRYRVDRMYEVDVLQERISAKAEKEFSKISIDEYNEQMFGMHDGEKDDVTLCFTDKILGSVYDQFGEDITVENKGDGMLEATVTVRISNPFFGWVAQFAGDMQITAPEQRTEQYREFVGKLLR